MTPGLGIGQPGFPYAKGPRSSPPENPTETQKSWGRRKTSNEDRPITCLKGGGGNGGEKRGPLKNRSCGETTQRCAWVSKGTRLDLPLEN